MPTVTWAGREIISPSFYAQTSLHLLQGCHLGLLHDSSEILLCLLQRSDWGVLLWHA